jgi:hypothetical protein
MLGLRKLGDVGAGVFQSDATARQSYRINELMFSIHAALSVNCSPGLTNPFRRASGFLTTQVCCYVFSL